MARAYRMGFVPDQSYPVQESTEKKGNSEETQKEGSSEEEGEK